MVKNLFSKLGFESFSDCFKKMDKVLLFFTIFLLIFGLVMVFSASNVTSFMYYEKSILNFVTKQGLFILIGLFVGSFIIRLDFNKIRTVSHFVMIFLVVLLIVVLVLGTAFNKAKSWIPIGPFTLQPSEFVKVCSIIWVSYFFDKKYTNPIVSYSVMGITLGLSFLLIVLQPDLGTACIYLMIMGIMILNFDISKTVMKRMIFFVLCFLFLVVVIYLASPWVRDFFSMQAGRLNLKYLDPCNAEVYYKSGTQVCNSLIAINTGGVFGKGLGNSIQKYLYLPEAYSDFIFAIIVEELGLVGGLVVLISLFIVLYRIYRIGIASKNKQNKLFCVGVFWYILIHIFVNLGGITATIPLTGVPLPFFSYGGSFMICLIVSISLVQRISVENNKDKNKN